MDEDDDIGWYERCPDCPPGEDREGVGMWWKGDFLVVCETCDGSGLVKHEH